MDRGAWQAIVHGLAKSLTRLSDFHSTFCLEHHPQKADGTYQPIALKAFLK